MANVSTDIEHRIEYHYDSEKNSWIPVSYETSSDDVMFSDGTTLTTQINDLKAYGADVKSRSAAAVSSIGVSTASDADWNTIISNIKDTAVVNYNSGHTDGYNSGYSNGYSAGNSAGYSKGVTDADNRVNGNSVNWKDGYNNGYNRGVTDADNRANGNSVNYRTGYNNGHWAGRNDPLLYLNSVSAYVGSGGDGNFRYTYNVNGATSFRVVCNGMPGCAFVWGPGTAVESSATALFYDANSNQIGSVGIGSGGTYSIPGGTSYIVINHGGWQGSAAKQYNISLIGLH